MDELLAQFLVECAELTEQAGSDLVALERNPGDPEPLNSAFRAMHTLKGSAGLFDLQPMSEVLHAGEDVLGALRDGRLRVDASTIEPLLACIAQTERWAGSLRRTEVLPDDAPAVASALTAALQACLGRTGAIAPPSEAPSMRWAEELARSLAPHAHGALVAVRYTPDRQAYFNGDDPLAIVRAVPDLAGLDITLGEPAADDYDPFACTLRLCLVSTAPPDAVRAAFRLAGGRWDIASVAAARVPPPADDAAPPEAGSSRSMRVDPARIDQLARLVDELVVAKNALGQFAAVQEALPAADRARQLGAVVEGIGALTGALHRAATAARLTPFAPVFRRLPRIVREIAAGLGKTVDLDVEGGDVEADKAVVDAIYEPLLHLLRNAVDHGIEMPEERRRAGKPARAAIRLHAAAVRQEVVISVSDDGAGVDPARVRATAASRGLLAAERLAALDDAAVLDLVFAPGFSTASTVSALSGRGVGMDAVRTAALRLGGRVSLSSALGQGTRVELVLPLTVVLSQILLVTCGGERFGVAMNGVLETARVRRAEIKPVRQGRAFVLRDRVVPLLALSSLLGLPAAAPEDGDCTVLVAASHGEPVGLAVDQVLDRTETVLRPMRGLLAGMPGMAGTTLMGDGSVLMVLDVEELTA